MKLPQIIENIAAQLGVSAPQQEADGKYLFTFDGLHEIALLQEGEDIRIEAEISDELKGSDSEMERQYKHLLQANLARSRQFAESLSVNPHTGRVILYRNLPGSRISEHDVLDAVEKFLNTLEYWKKILSQESSAPMPSTFFMYR